MAEATSQFSSVLQSVSLGRFQGYDSRSCINITVLTAVKTSDRFAGEHKKFTISKKKHQNLKGFLQRRRCSSSIIASGLQDEQEDKWLREERRWLREEERWLREESRWNAERKGLLQQSEILKQEIIALNAKIAQLQEQIKDGEENDQSISNLIVSLTQLLQSLNAASSVNPVVSSATNQIPPTSSSATDINIVLDDVKLEDLKTFVDVKPEDLKTPPVQSPISVSKSIEPSISVNSGITDKPNLVSTSLLKSKRSLKRGSEGDDVKAMQEALEKLGYYCGEEDMEYSMFSTGTERAVQTWQATLGIAEDGIMTSELLAKLFGEDDRDDDSSKKDVLPSTKQDSAVPPTQAQSPAVSGSKVQSPSPVNDKTSNISERRVYLLGENRWEEPSRLRQNNGRVSTSTTKNSSVEETCFSCKGVGTMLCTECEGTGELNVEEQFLEWVEEGAKCPYCEGQGVLNCDLCDGKGAKTA